MRAPRVEGLATTGDPVSDTGAGHTAGAAGDACTASPEGKDGGLGSSLPLVSPIPLHRSKEEEALRK